MLSKPVRSFLSSSSFWKFSIFIMTPCSCSTISEMSAKAAARTEKPVRTGRTAPELGEAGPAGTSAVPEVLVGGRVVLAEPLQQQLVVQQAVQRPEQEDVERQVAEPLLLEVSAQSLHLPAGPADGNVKNPP